MGSNKWQEDELKMRLKRLIIDTLRLEDVSPDEIDDEEPLFGEGLGLDSVDALELVVALEKNFGVEIEDEQMGRKIFASINTLTEFVTREAKNRS